MLRMSSSWLLGGLADAPEHRHDGWRRQPERRTDADRVRLRVERRRVGGDLDGVAALVRRIVVGGGGAALVGIVGGRAEAEEFEAVGVVVGVEQVGELLRGVAGGERARHAEDEQAVEAGAQRGGRHGDAQRHALGLGLVEVDHPLHAGIDLQLVVGGDAVAASADWGRDRHRAAARCRGRPPEWRWCRI